jgi:hypothetical protein
MNKQYIHIFNCVIWQRMFYSPCERKITENLEKIARRNFYGQYQIVSFKLSSLFRAIFFIRYTPDLKRTCCRCVWSMPRWAGRRLTRGLHFFPEISKKLICRCRNLRLSEVKLRQNLWNCANLRRPTRQLTRIFASNN